MKTKITYKCDFYLQSVRRMEISALESLLAMAANIFWSFLLCYMATASSDTVASIGDIVYNGNWPEYPPIYRKYVLLMILRSQQPTRFTGLKMVYCTLENFTKVGAQCLFVSYCICESFK